MIAWGREERPPSPKRDAGASAARSSGPQASPSPAAPKLAPRPRDPVPVPAADTFALLFLPPVLSLVHPALYHPASIPVLLTPTRNTVSLPTWLFLDEKMCSSGDILCTAWKLKHQEQKKRDHEQAY